MANDNRKFIAVTGTVDISTANTNLDGTGSMGTVLTGAGDGTSINTITIKAAESNAEGMIRLFINKGLNTLLWREIPVPANVQSATIPAYQTTVVVRFTIEDGDVLMASTQNAENWVVIAEGVKWINDGCAPTVQLPTPTGLSLTGIDAAIDCNCNNVLAAEVYEWQRADDPIFETNVVTGTMSISEFVFGGLGVTLYYVRVRAKATGYIDSEWATGSATPT